MKKALNYGLILKKAHRVVKFNQKAWLKPDIDMNTKLRKKAKRNWERLLQADKMQFLEKLWKMWINIEILNL